MVRNDVALFNSRRLIFQSYYNHSSSCQCLASSLQMTDRIQETRFRVNSSACRLSSLWLPGGPAPSASTVMARSPSLFPPATALLVRFVPFLPVSSPQHPSRSSSCVTPRCYLPESLQFPPRPLAPSPSTTAVVPSPPHRSLP